MAEIKWVPVRCNLTIPSQKIKGIKYVRAIVNSYLLENLKGYHMETCNGYHPKRFGLKDAKYFVEGVETMIPYGAISFLEKGIPQNISIHKDFERRYMVPAYHQNSLVFDYELNDIEILLLIVI